MKKSKEEKRRLFRIIKACGQCSFLTTYCPSSSGLGRACSEQAVSTRRLLSEQRPASWHTHTCSHSQKFLLNLRSGNEPGFTGRPETVLQVPAVGEQIGIRIIKSLKYSKLCAEHVRASSCFWIYPRTLSSPPFPIFFKQLGQVRLTWPDPL